MDMLYNALLVVAAGFLFLKITGKKAVSQMHHSIYCTFLSLPILLVPCGS